MNPKGVMDGEPVNIPALVELRWGDGVMKGVRTDGIVR